VPSGRQTVAIEGAIEDALGVIHFSMSNEVNTVSGHKSQCRRRTRERPSHALVDSLTVTNRTLIADLAYLPHDSQVRVSGWVDTVRDQKKVQFVILRDESGALQLVNPAVREGDEAAANEPERLALTEAISSLTQGSMVTVDGTLLIDERVKLGGLEVRIGSMDIASLAYPEPPIEEDSSVDKRMDWRFLDLRRKEAQLIFKVQTTFEHALRTWWVKNGFIEIHTPKLMASASESRAELFELDYFDTTAYLAQSPQFFKQMAQSAGFGKIFEIAPAFRADPSFTARHATEFTSVDMEVSWIDSHEDVMAIHEQLLKTAIDAVIEAHGEAIQEILGVELESPTLPFPRVSLAEARELVKEAGYEIPRADGDLDPEAERQLCALVKERHSSDFVFVTDYDSTIRPFYHMRHSDNPALTNSYDLLYNGTEISTGAQREHRVDVLEAQAAEKGLSASDLEHYLDFFRHGVPPHGGFGMGLARVMMLMLGQASIRETTYLFRGPNRLLP
jgi:nondiscriminating aspartyl-tRNA synthetase